MIPLRHLVSAAATAALLMACSNGNASVPVKADAPAVTQTSARTSPVAAEASTGFASETKTFRDWIAICDNGNDCAAYGPAEDNGGFVMVKLAAGPDAQPQVLADSWALDAGTELIRLDIDGRNYSGKTENRGEFNILTIDRPSDQLMSALAHGRAMTLSAKGETVPVSLTGAAAAFLWIDERQGRLGTPTALIRKGTRSARSVPAAPALPRVTVAAPATQRDLPKALSPHVTSLPRARECAALYENTDNGRNDWAVHRLGADVLLWELPCGAGAYNFSQAYVISANDGSNPQAVDFPTPRGPIDSLVNSDFDSATNTLSAFGKGRGLGDCGSMGSWAWTGREFRLLSEDNMSDCLGLHWDLWPSTWRTAR